jgi:hypothetical protein
MENNRYSTNPNIAFNQWDEDMKHEDTITQHEDDYVLLQKEMHYHNTINAFVELIDEHGWPKVVGDVREKLLLRDWWSPC